MKDRPTHPERRKPKTDEEFFVTAEEPFRLEDEVLNNHPAWEGAKAYHDEDDDDDEEIEPFFPPEPEAGEG